MEQNSTPLPPNVSHNRTHIVLITLTIITIAVIVGIFGYLLGVRSQKSLFGAAPPPTTEPSPTPTVTPGIAQGGLPGGPANPLQVPLEFARARNTQRRSDTMAILNAVGQYQAEHKGDMPPGILSTPQKLSSSGVNLCQYLVPMYLPAMPTDPALQTKAVEEPQGARQDRPIQATCPSNYDTGYTIQKDGIRITVAAPNAELSEVISVTR